MFACVITSAAIATVLMMHAISMTGFMRPLELASAKFDSVSCTEFAEQVLKTSQGKLLSIQPNEGSCTVVVLILQDGKRPRRVVFTADGSST